MSLYWRLVASLASFFKFFWYRIPDVFVAVEEIWSCRFVEHFPSVSSSWWSQLFSVARESWPRAFDALVDPNLCTALLKVMGGPRYLISLSGDKISMPIRCNRYRAFFWLVMFRCRWSLFCRCGCVEVVQCGGRVFWVRRWWDWCRLRIWRWRGSRLGKSDSAVVSVPLLSFRSELNKGVSSGSDCVVPRWRWNCFRLTCACHVTRCLSESFDGIWMYGSSMFCSFTAFQMLLCSNVSNAVFWSWCLRPKASGASRRLSAWAAGVCVALYEGCFVIRLDGVWRGGLRRLKRVWPKSLYKMGIEQLRREVDGDDGSPLLKVIWVVESRQFGGCSSLGLVILLSHHHSENENGRMRMIIRPVSLLYAKSLICLGCSVRGPWFFFCLVKYSCASTCHMGWSGLERATRMRSMAGTAVVFRLSHVGTLQRRCPFDRIRDVEHGNSTSCRAHASSSNDWSGGGTRDKRNDIWCSSHISGGSGNRVSKTRQWREHSLVLMADERPTFFGQGLLRRWW